MRKLRPQEAESLNHSCTARKQRSWDSDPDSLAPDLRLLTTLLFHVSDDQVMEVWSHPGSGAPVLDVAGGLQVPEPAGLVRMGHQWEPGGSVDRLPPSHNGKGWQLWERQVDSVGTDLFSQL